MDLVKFERLDVWRRAARLSAEVFRGVRDLKDYGFKDQLTRSGLSIPSNIAEGIEHSFPADCVKFLLYAKGSCGELRTQIFIGMEIEYIDRELGREWIAETEAVSSMLGGLIRTKRSRMK
jgi:four helix bundle protein